MCEWQPSFFKKAERRFRPRQGPPTNAVDWAKVVHHTLALSFPESETSVSISRGTRIGCVEKLKHVA